MAVYPKRVLRVRGSTPPLEASALKLRREMTPAEVRLWNALKDRKLGGLKFRAQHPVGRFILDFYCPSQRLVVELDGGVHEKQLEYDQARTEFLNAYGYRVVRFPNEEVLTNLTSVLKQILQVAKTTEEAR
jgi:very-short-patch-repair endonuclease